LKPTLSQAQPIVVDDIFSASSAHAVPKPVEMQHDPKPPLESLETPLDKFLSGPIGVDLDTTTIAHDARIQALLDLKQISWGVQFELARGVTTGQWTWDVVESKISELSGPSAKTAYRVRSVMLNVPQRGNSDLAIW
jgi:hypothetical protein